MRTKLMILLVVASCALLAFTSPTMAQSPTEDAYGGLAGTTQGGEPPSPTTTTNSTSETLPFTGLELGFMALIGVGVAGTGFVIRRAAGGGMAE